MLTTEQKQELKKKKERRIVIMEALTNYDSFFYPLISNMNIHDEWLRILQNEEADMHMRLREINRRIIELERIEKEPLPLPRSASNRL